MQEPPIISPASSFILNSTRKKLRESSEDNNYDPAIIKGCNYSSMAFYVFELAYASYLLYRLIYKNDKSRSLIFATSMIAVACLSLIAFFAWTDMGFYTNP